VVIFSRAIKKKALKRFFSKKIAAQIINNKKCQINEGTFQRVEGLYVCINLEYKSIEEYHFLSNLFENTVKKNDGMFDSIINGMFTAFFSYDLLSSNIYKNAEDALDEIIDYLNKNGYQFGVGISYGEVMLGDLLSYDDAIDYIYGDICNKAISLSLKKTNQIILSDNVPDGIKREFTKIYVK
jgi:hypothetical protein